MSAGDARIRVAREHELDRVGELVSAAFFDEPVTRWLLPDVRERAVRAPALFTAITREVFATGTVYVHGDYEGAALWVDLTGEGGDDAGHDAAASAAEDPFVEIMGPYADRWSTFVKIVDANHPADPHHYLFIMGVRPPLQGRGIGARLLGHHHARIAEAGWPAYLEATSVDSRRLYGRHGFADQGPAPLLLPEGPPIWPMWRPADAMEGAA